MEDLIKKLESILFVASKPMSAKQLAKFVNAKEEETKQALDQLVETRKNSGIVLLNAGGNFQLASHPDYGNLVKDFLQSDLRENLTEATLEVLAIIAYRQPISKAEIESIRGVNSQYSLRQLLMRGLIEKTANANDGRSSYYQITTEFLQHMGLQKIEDLTDFASLTAQIKLPESPANEVMADSSQPESSEPHASAPLSDNPQPEA